MNTQTTTVRNGKGDTRMKNPLKPPRFSKNINFSNTTKINLMNSDGIYTQVKESDNESDRIPSVGIR